MTLRLPANPIGCRAKLPNRSGPQGFARRPETISDQPRCTSGHAIPAAQLAGLRRSARWLRESPAHRLRYNPDGPGAAQIRYGLKL